MTKFNTKFRIRIENEAHLSSLLDVKISVWVIVILFILGIASAILIASVIVMVTPLHTVLPGYLKEDQRSATEENLLRLDSLQDVYKVNQQFIDNFLLISDTDRIPADSINLHPDSIDTVSDTLISPGEREKRFVSRMEEQERFNISVLAPLAADGMTFSFPAESGIFTGLSKESLTGEVILPADNNVISVADGTVVASYYSHAEKGYVILIQHPRGFVSRYSHTGNPMVGLGEEVLVGQIIAPSHAPDSKGNRYFYINMWHNGSAVIPFKYLNPQSASLKNENFGKENFYDAPRGK